MFTAYQEAENWLFSQLANYQKIGTAAYKPGLDNIKTLLNLLDNPQNEFKSIHIAGTNGKGSTAHMLSSVMQEAGYKIGLFTSPHLKYFSERIKINGQEISENYVLNFINKVFELSNDIKPSFFEITTALTFDYFAHNQVDMAVVETGLGGRLDSTNIINPVLSIITNISLDHQDLLGTTIAEITHEKAGIIKPHTPIVCGDIKPKVQSIVRNIADINQSKYIQSISIPNHITSDLMGNYQQENLNTVWTSLLELQALGFKISENAIRNGFKQVQKNTGLRGRWEIIDNKPLTIIDTGHNIGAFEWIASKLKTYPQDKLHIVLGFVQGKDIEPIFKLLPPNAHYYFVKPDIFRAFNPIDYESIIQKYFSRYKIFSSVTDGFKAAKLSSNEKDTIFVGGSFFVVGEII